MPSSARHSAAVNNRVITGHVLTLHQRLYHALSLGSWENREAWRCPDIEIQRLVLRSIDAFLECISGETLQHPLVKDSVVDMVRALENILESKNTSILGLASNVIVKMVNTLPSSMLQSCHSDVISPLASLLSSQQLQIAMACANAMNVILSKLSSRREGEVGKILKERNAVGHIVHNIKQYDIDDKPIEYFQEMAFLLSKILWRWTFFRFCVWNDSRLLEALDAIRLMSGNAVKVAVLQLYSSLALCDKGAEKLLENGAALLQFMVDCMECSNANSVRVEAFKLARCLSLSRQGCIKMMNVCSQPLVKAVTSAMNDWSSQFKKADKSRLLVMKEACRLASITHWEGDHHLYFWEAGMDRLLLDLLLENYSKVHQLQHDVSMCDLIIIVRENRIADALLPFKPFIWDILGGLAANCEKNINHEMHGNKLRLTTLIICACWSFVDSVGMLSQVSQTGPTNMSECESASRAVLMMVYSPCTHIASLSRSILCEILKLDSTDIVEYLLNMLNSRLTGNKFVLPDNLQIVVSLMSLACYCSLPQYRKIIIKLQGMKTLMAFTMWWLKTPLHTKRASIVPHLHDSFIERTCCFPSSEEWEGEDMLLLFSLWILAELLHHSAPTKVNPSDEQFSEAELIQKLQEICRDRRCHGSSWYAAYVLSCFGLYGFPSNLGKRIGKALGEKEHSDVRLNLVNDGSVYAHEVILAVRCPSLLPPLEPAPKEKSSGGSTAEQDMGRNSIRTVCLSAHVDQQSLLKLMEYVYSGYLQASKDIAKKLRVFAKHCKLESLMQMLYKRNPKWGVPIPVFDLTPALGPAGHYLSNLLLEASNTTQLLCWKCNSCSALVPHLHVHRVIMESNCEYLRALFQSGMQESHLQTIKVPVSWEPLNKLVRWFYSDQLPVPTFDCCWDNLDLDEKSREVHTYLELCWLAEFWVIEDLQEQCYQVVISCLDSSRDLSAKIIQSAADLSLWSVAQVAANHMAPSYHHLRNSGELDALDSNLVEMVRAASVRLSRESSHHST